MSRPRYTCPDAAKCGCIPRETTGGATLVTAPYIVFLDADDLLVAPGIHESLRILSAQADCAVVAGRVMASLPRGVVG